MRQFGRNVVTGLLVLAAALLGATAGLLLSAVWDLPSGSTLVATFGAALIVCTAAGALVRRGRVQPRAVVSTAQSATRPVTEGMPVRE